MGLRYIKYAILIIVSIGFILAICLLGPIPQSIEYHQFADQRSFMHIPHFFNVVSNFVFILVGIFGILLVLKSRQKFIHSSERIFYIIFFVGVFLIGFGSSYYHWNPTYKTLVWDRLSMVIALESFFAAMLAERINLKLGLYSLIPLLLAGFGSVFYWSYTESIGKGDLRFYIIMHYLPVALIIVLLSAFKPRYSKQIYIWYALIAYIIAKVCEASDQIIYNYFHEFISGHTLKHLWAALGSYFILAYIKSRKSIES